MGSRRFFWGVLAFFVLESCWIAVSAVYPQAFDENFHFGLIQIYARYWLPFLAHQPAGADAYGAVAHDPSYLYHYLMSFPYRLLAFLTHSQEAQIVGLRLLNVGFAAAALVLFRRMLLRARLSGALAHTALALYVLIPIVPQLAGQINYDNLLLPLVAFVALLGMRSIDDLRAGRPSAARLVVLLASCLLASLVKYEFLPIFVGVMACLVAVAFTRYQGAWRSLRSQLLASWRRLSLARQILLVAFLALGLGLFAQRDGLNLVLYHSLAPDCSKALNLDSCSSYSPWDYSHQQHQIVQSQGQSASFMGPVAYTGSWVYWLWYRLFFAVNGLHSGYTNYPPLPLPAAAAALIGVAGVVLVVARRRQLVRGDSYVPFFVTLTVLYLMALWAEGFAQYHYTQVLQIMNGRYLLPVVPFMAVLFGLAFREVLRRRIRVKAALAALAVVCFLQGGGVMTFILRSDAAWYWPSATIVSMNNAARQVINPLVLEGSREYDTTFWFFNYRSWSK